MKKDNKNPLKILDTDINGTTLKEMTGSLFSVWVLRKLNNQPTYDSRVQELVTQYSHLLGRTISDDAKLETVRKLQVLDIEIN